MDAMGYPKPADRDCDTRITRLTCWSVIRRQLQSEARLRWPEKSDLVPFGYSACWLTDAAAAWRDKLT